MMMGCKKKLEPWCLMVGRVLRELGKCSFPSCLKENWVNDVRDWSLVSWLGHCLTWVWLTEDQGDKRTERCCSENWRICPRGKCEALCSGTDSKGNEPPGRAPSCTVYRHAQTRANRNYLYIGYIRQRCSVEDRIRRIIETVWIKMLNVLLLTPTLGGRIHLA